MLTIFTPTYNRADMLNRVYNSLVNQSRHDFLWLIVDDGSTDNTKAVVDSFISEGIIDIEYHYRENGGKMRAHNQGVELCRTELFMCLDSDDYITSDAVENIYVRWAKKRTCVNCERNIGGIVAHKGRSNTSLLGNSEFPSGVEISTLRGLYRAGFRGETTLVFLTEALKKYPFPEFEGEKYVPEDVVYDKIDSEYELIVMPKIITVCEIVADGYTDQAARLRRENPKGWHRYYEQRMNLEPVSVLKFKYVSHYIIFSRILGINPFAAKKIGAGYLIAGYIGAFALKIAGKT